MTNVACAIVSADDAILTLQRDFEKKYLGFAKLMGDNCGLMSTVANLYKDAGNVNAEWQREFEGVISNLISVSSQAYTFLKDIIAKNKIAQAGIDMIKEAIEMISEIFDEISDVIDVLSDIVGQAVDAITTLTCKISVGIVRSLPAELIAANNVYSLIKGHDFTLDDLGAPIVKRSDIEKITTDLMKLNGIESIKDRFINQASRVINARLSFDITQFACKG